MKYKNHFLSFPLLLFVLLCSIPLAAQIDIFNAQDDTFCVELGDGFQASVLDNDTYPQDETPKVQLLAESPCFIINEETGVLRFRDNEEDCCGEHILKYRIVGCQGGEFCIGTINVTVKCGKPECFLVNIEDFISVQDPAGGDPNNSSCAYACENSNATYFATYNPLNTYVWNVNGGTNSPGTNDAEINVAWGAMGAGSVTLTTVGPNGETTIIEVCVEILETPTADFSVFSPIVCLNSPLTFTNNSIDGDDYFWDFGDGNTSSLFEPTHAYTAAGVYAVTLLVTKNNFDAEGNALCCCTDTISMNITVDPLEGPAIYCVSTLCAKDDAKYWTNAIDCASYNWIVLDENDLPIAFDGQGTDSICVQWGDGPFGTVILDASDCEDDYCPNPTVVKVPIIPAIANIDGAIEVCEFITETYAVPKWISVTYDWVVTGGTILAGENSHTIIVQWGSAGVGTIVLNYGSDFLGGLPGHDAPDCTGSAMLTINIAPKFEIFTPIPNTVCLNATSSISATFSPSANYTWAISPAATFTGQNTNNINVTWDAGPGVYQITAVPDDATAYCNDTVSIFMTVVEVPLPDAINGELDICPGETATYFGETTTPNVGFFWNITGGNVPTFTGNPLTITWDAVGPYAISLQQFQLVEPYCTSDAISLALTPKVINPFAVTGAAVSCINEIETYFSAALQHPDATYFWSIDNPALGNIISGQGTSTAQIQWNNDGGAVNLSLSITLCGSTITETLLINLAAPPTPIITQIGTLCTGVTAVLDAGAGYDAYLWSTGSTSQTTTITTGGNYILTITDGGCQKIVNFQATELPGPTAAITSSDLTTICIDPPTETVTILAQTQPGYTFQWYCNGALQVPTGPIFSHTNTNIVATFAYWVVVTDSQGCMKTSNTITVKQIDDCDNNGPGGCTIPHTLTFTANNDVPNCNIGVFEVTASANVTVNSWNFDDPAGNTNDGTLPNAMHTFTTAGCYRVTVSATVIGPAGATCTVTESGEICIPIAADFTFTENCGLISFTDGSTFLPGADITNWDWNFGDGNGDVVQHPMHTYAMPGTYTVSLTVRNADGCKVVISQDITVIGVPNPVVTAMPNPACVGVAVDFTGTAANVASWFWDFDDTTNNGAQNPSHAFAAPGLHDVVLTIITDEGCTSSASIEVEVFPALPAGAISFAPSLTFCEGETTVLSAPTGVGYVYAWSTGETTANITVGTSGIYGVTITDANGCELVLDPVSVTVFPLPVAYISGNLFICDDGCITLTAPIGFGYAYVWLDDLGNPIPGQTGMSLMVCATDLLSGYAVQVKDANECIAVSDVVVVKVVPSPAFAIVVDPDGCEGTLNTLKIDHEQPDVVYTWNTGETGIFIETMQAGVYTAIGTDTLTGCRGTASATIHPLPDLCIIPVGCYEICNPDTICAPAGLTTYQWNLDGVPLSDETGQCIIITESGTYSFTGTTEFGCELTTEDLILEVINCDCEALNVTADPLDNCCWAFTYDNTYGDLFGIMVHTDDADLMVDLAELPPVLSIYTIGDNWVGLVNSMSGEPLPNGVIDDFLTLCLDNITNDPQQVIFDWYDFDFEVVCTDSLTLTCPLEVDCLYMSSDSIYCENNEIIYELTVCNPINSDFAIEYVQIIPSSPVGIIVSPSSFDLSANPIAPGDCEDLTVVLSGPNLANETFCYKLVAHEFDPAQVDTALCCSFDTTYCIQIPDCNPCDDIGIKEVERTGECCYDILLFNDFDANYFDGIGLCMLTPNASMTIDNPFGSGWSTNSYSPTFIDLVPTFPIGNTLPLGDIQLPELCINTTAAATQLVEIKWMHNGEIVCRDTIELRCEPECGYIFDERIECTSAGWNYSGLIKNTSDYTMSEGHFSFTSPAGMSIYDQTINLGALLPGASTAFNFNIGAPGMEGDTVCFTLALHEADDNGQHINCCNIEHCIVLPECNLLGTAPREELGVLPNPSSGLFNLILPLQATGKVNIQLYDIHNIRIAQWTKEAAKGSENIPMDISKHAKGVYILVVENATERWVTRVVLQ